LARLFYGSVLAGVVLTILAAGVFPLPQHQRYRSNISVVPDGGREESFTIQWPQDRVQPLGPAASGPLLSQAGGAAILRDGDGIGASAEVFRLRDSAGNVIGLASRSTSLRTAHDGASGQGTDWILLLPSRGSLFLTQANSRDVGPRTRAPDGGAASLVPAPDGPGFWADGTRLTITAGPAQGGAGQVLGGTEEFADLQGTYQENWELEEVAADGSTRGHITLVTRVEATP
jgi:hypothetical protein